VDGVIFSHNGAHHLFS